MLLRGRREREYLTKRGHAFLARLGFREDTHVKVSCKGFPCFVAKKKYTLTPDRYEDQWATANTFLVLRLAGWGIAILPKIRCSLQWLILRRCSPSAPERAIVERAR